MKTIEQQHQVRRGRAAALGWAMHQFNTNHRHAEPQLDAASVLLIFGTNDDALQKIAQKFQGYFFSGTGV